MPSSLKNDRLLRALLRQPVDATPIWIMRQAGRYLPEYRKLRELAGDFMTLCKTPDLACQVTLQPVERFPLDAAILFSDILTIPDAMGLGLSIIESKGPMFEYPVRSAQQIKKLGIPDPETDLRYVMDAVRLIRKELDGRVPLIGFSGSPWTLATYMVEGQSSKNFSVIKELLYDQPQVLHELLEKLAQSVALYLNAQIAAGAQTVMIFDTWGGVLTQPAYQEFSLTYMQKIVGQLQREMNGQRIPVILFSKGIGDMVIKIAETGCDAIGLDWMQDIAQVRSKVGDKVALQGNLDPAVLYASPEVIKKEVGKILESYGKGSGHVFNLGHGIHPEIDPEHVAVLVDAVHEFSKPYHRES
ncbi:MAG: uroporphyrinogen decarboxylase [Gammaproteobacteria bacterium RIFCSPLOWO2_12_47_11]|nr:MAG: uroporphyrinogen decarboxylase [Gammaproteobacteria bacterium RIFCSPLOWO2_12_47_11]